MEILKFRQRSYKLELLVISIRLYETLYKYVPAMNTFTNSSNIIQYKMIVDQGPGPDIWTPA